MQIEREREQRHEITYRRKTINVYDVTNTLAHLARLPDKKYHPFVQYHKYERIICMLNIDVCVYIIHMYQSGHMYNRIHSEVAAVANNFNTYYCAKCES